MNELVLGSVRDPTSKNKEDREQLRKTPVSNYGHAHTQNLMKINIGSYYKTSMCSFIVRSVFVLNYFFKSNYCPCNI